jgi:hypothetical protein
MSRRVLIAIGVSLVAAMGTPAAAQDEGALRSFFEGRRVTPTIDMPATSDGVDVHADSSRPLDYQQYGERLKEYGTAIHARESATVTLVKMKKDLIEFQLGGGGFGTFGDDTSTSVYIPYVERSSREKDLDRQIRDEDDKRRRRRLEDERDELRERRERANRRIDAERAIAETRKKELVAQRRLAGGSRFNLRYENAVPSGIRPEEVMAALAQFVDFSPGGFPRVVEDFPASRDDRSVGGLPRKGMTRAEAEREFGPAVNANERREGGLMVTTLRFASRDQQITADFVEDVLVRFSMTSR